MKCTNLDLLNPGIHDSSLHAFIGCMHVKLNRYDFCQCETQWSPQSLPWEQFLGQGLLAVGLNEH